MFILLFDLLAKENVLPIAKAKAIYDSAVSASHIVSSVSSVPDAANSSASVNHVTGNLNKTVTTSKNLIKKIASSSVKTKVVAGAVAAAIVAGTVGVLTLTAKKHVTPLSISLSSKATSSSTLKLKSTTADTYKLETLGTGEWDRISTVSNESKIITVEKNGKYGLVNFNGQQLGNVEWDKVEDFKNGFARVQKDGNGHL